MSDCSKHKQEIAGITDMRLLAEMIGDLHYGTLTQLMYNLSKKIEADAKKDHEAGREKLADALQYSGMSIFETALRIEKVWNICKPIMDNNGKSNSHTSDKS